MPQLLQRFMPQCRNCSMPQCCTPEPEPEQETGMRLKHGTSVRIALNDGTTFVGTVRFSWRWGILKLTNVITQTRDGEIQADGYLLIPVRSVLFAQVGDE